MGASYGVADAPVRTTDDPEVMAVARENEVVRERGESARLRGELSRLQREVDEGRLSAADKLAQEQQARDDEQNRQQTESNPDTRRLQQNRNTDGPNVVGEPGRESTSLASGAQVEYSEPASSTTSSASTGDQKWSSARTRGATGATPSGSKSSRK
jgi:hypothetical protein